MSLVATLLLGKPINLPTGTPRMILSCDIKPTRTPKTPMRVGYKATSPMRSTASIATQRHIVGIIAERGRATVYDLADTLNVSVNTVRNHLAALCDIGAVMIENARKSNKADTYIVINPRAIDNVEPDDNPWRPEEDKLLKAHIYTCSMAALAKKIGRSRSAITNRGKLLGLIL